MTVLVDANLLVYAALAQAPEHAPARGWLTGVFADDDEVVGLAWSSRYAVARLLSNRRIMGDDAVGLTEAWSAAEAYRRQPNAVIVEPGSGHASPSSEASPWPPTTTASPASADCAGLTR